MKFKSLYGDKIKKSLKFEKPSLTQQNFANECDINNIMKRYQKTGILPEMIKKNPQYGEFADVQDYQESMNIINFSKSQFDLLSAEARAFFQNDVKNFLEYVSDAKNIKGMVDLGILDKSVLYRPKSELGEAVTSEAGNNPVSGTETQPTTK